MAQARHIGKYEILEGLGRGGFATVYKARDTKLDRVVALKVLHPYWREDPGFAERFQREARAAANLRHPSIVTIYEADEAGGQLYIAMEYLPGRSLKELLSAEGALPPERALPILEQVADALDYAHEQDVVHRDIKPANVMVEDTPRDKRATLLDFGLVKALQMSTALTSHGTLLGSPEYMAPEQADPNRASEIGPAADRYALGIVAYQMLTGRVPFPGDTPATLYAHEHKPVPSPRSLRPGLPRPVDAALLKMLAKAPAERFRSCAAFVEQLRAVRSTPDQARPAPTPPAPGVARPSPPRLARARRALESKPVPKQDLRLWERDGKEMVRVPGGEFLYGDEKRQLSADEFWIDEAPVTNAEYARFVAANDRTPPQHWKGKTPPQNIADHPVTHVDWDDAVAYAKWAGKRLPTEEEWEKAARGTDGRRYPWGDDPPTKESCNFNQNVGSTTPVGKYSPQGDSPYGCVDMAGNVWEWTASDYDENRKVLRGGGWRRGEIYVRAAFRFSDSPGLRSDYVGFRCVSAVPGV